MTKQSDRYVIRGAIWFGPAPTIADAKRESMSESGGAVTNQTPPPGVTVVPWDRVHTNTGKEKRVPLPATSDGVIDTDLTPIDELSDEWEDLQMAGLAASEGQERRRWYLGDLAQKVARKYGQSSLKSFSGDIKIPKVATLRDYERTSQFYPFSARAEYPELTWSHYREAIKAGELELAMDWLEKANNFKWNVVRLGQAIEKTHGKTVKVSHKYDVEPVQQGQGRLLFKASDLDIENYVARLAEGRSCDDFAVTVVVSWLARQEPEKAA